MMDSSSRMTDKVLLETLLNLPVPKSPYISPDARKVVYCTSFAADSRVSDNLVSTVWIASLGETASARQLTDGLSHDRQAKWCLSGLSVAFLSDCYKRRASCAIYACSLDGGEPYPLTPVENERPIKSFETGPDGRTIVFISADEKTAKQRQKEKTKDDPFVWGLDQPYHRLRSVDVLTKKTNTLISVDAHVVNFAWSDDGKKIVYAIVDSPDPESYHLYGTTFCILDLDEMATHKLCTFPNSIGDMVYSQDRVYFIGNATDTSLVSASMVYVIDTTSHQVIYEKHSYGVENCARSLGKSGSSVIVKVQHGMANQLHVLGGEKLLDEANQIKGYDVQVTGTNNEFVLAFVQSSTNKPPEVYSTNGRDGSFIQLSEHGRACMNHKFGSSTLFSCRSADDQVRLDAVWSAPSSHTGSVTPLPTIVFIHGGPYSRHTDAFDNTYFLWGPIILNAGYGLLVPNYRGGAGRGDKFAACARGIGKYDYEDIIAITNHAVKAGYADPQRLLVCGWSHGGTLSYLCSVRNGLHGHGWKFQAAIAGAAMCDIDTSILTANKSFWKAEIGGKAPWLSDKSDTTNRQGSALWEFHGALKSGGVIPPILILHSERDRQIGVEQARAMRRALQAANLPFEYVVYPRETHMPTEQKHLLDMGERVLRFIEKYI